MKITNDTLNALLAFMSEDKGATAGLLLGQDILRDLTEKTKQKDVENGESVDDGTADS